MTLKTAICIGALAFLAVAPMGGYGAPGRGETSSGHGAGVHLNGGAHQHFDGRYSHNQYYFDHGYSVRRAPAGGLGEFHGRDGGRYWFHGGHWYRWDQRGWVVWGAPIGLFLPFLPFYFTTVWWQGVPYYYANDTYYLWNDDQHQYQVVSPPDGIENGGIPQAPASNQLFIYPSHGQSADQQQKDRYECHRWAVSQSGFDPTISGGGVAPEESATKRDDYFRSQIACFEGRGYTVR